MAALTSWKDGAARRAIEDHVRRVTTPGSHDYVEPAARVAVFDNDGTLWCEKPMAVELGFILERLVEMAEADAALRDRQPWKAACTHDYRWLGDAITQHYRGDDSNVKVLVAALLKAFAGMTVEAYQERAIAFLERAAHPALKRRYRDCGYRPMVELLRFLEAKPVRIWSRTGRRPILAVGNANGDLQMLQFAGGPQHPAALRLVVLHDDAEREFAYTAGAEKVLEAARAKGWTVVSMKDDWTTVFAPLD